MKKISLRWSVLGQGSLVSRLSGGEREKLVHLEDILHQRVVGQDDAVKAVSEAVVRARAGIKILIVRSAHLFSLVLPALAKQSWLRL